jgi:hypothetical protein
VNSTETGVEGMGKKIVSSCILVLLRIGIVYSIWYYLLFQILTRVQATDLMWFLFWIYVPAGPILEGFLKLVVSPWLDHQSPKGLSSGLG